LDDDTVYYSDDENGCGNNKEDSSGYDPLKE
jgi:hypothetical protein